MKKIVKLTESDLVKLINKVVKEQTKSNVSVGNTNTATRKRCKQPATTTLPETGETVCNNANGWYASAQHARTCVCYGR
jgi:hypothetical protein